MLRIQPRSWKNRDGSVTQSWRLIIEDYTSGERVCSYPEKHRYPSYGFDASDTLELARQKLKAIQARNKITREAERKARIFKRLNTEAQKESAYLPRELYGRFLIWLRTKRMWDETPVKVESHLRAMRKLVLDANTPPSDWGMNPEKIYRWFFNERVSYSYIQKVLPLLNDYGYFYCHTFQKPFMEVKLPRGDVRRRIEDANLDERGLESSGASLPLTPALLAKLSTMESAEYRWMRWSFWFGLRPEEVDGLTEKNRDRRWRISTDDEGTLILHVYQTKLVSVERERRWKRIPAILPEQRACLVEIESGAEVKRPSTSLRPIRTRLGEGYGLYAGRKGFHKLMRSHGQNDLNISRWLGHLDIRRTEMHYRATEQVDYDPVPRKKKP